MVEGFPKCCKKFLAKGDHAQDADSVYKVWAGLLLDDSIADEDFLKREEHERFVRSIGKGTTADGCGQPDEISAVAGACSAAMSRLHPSLPPSNIKINFLDRQGLVRIVGFQKFCEVWLAEGGEKEPEKIYAAWASGLIKTAPGQDFMKNKVHLSFVERIWVKGLKENPVSFSKASFTPESAKDRQEHLNLLRVKDVHEALRDMDFREARAH